MRWLTIDNALQDYIAIIKYVKIKFPFLENAPVIVVGGTRASVKRHLLTQSDLQGARFPGSYGGFLSSLLRIKYPDVVFASIASSAAAYMLQRSFPVSIWFQTVR